MSGSDIVVAGDAGHVPPAASSELAVVDAVGPDRRVVELWLNGVTSPHTRRAYRRNCVLLYRFIGKPLPAIALDDLQAFAAHLQSSQLRAGSQHSMLAAVKSLFSFAARIGYLKFDPAVVLRLPSGKDTLSERILERDEVKRMIDGEPDKRNWLMLKLLYVAGVRVSELVELKWRDVQPSRGAGQITVFGKGGKTRAILLDGAVWDYLDAGRREGSLDDHVFKGVGAEHLSASQARRIVLAAARRAGINKPVSPHWLRHCHASHSLDKGAAISLVQATLGHSSVATTSRYLHARPNDSSSRFLD